MSNPFKKSTLAFLIGVVAASALITLALTIFGLDPEEESAGVDGYSVSAIGHQGLTELLPKLGIPTIVSRSDSTTKAKDGLLILAEPTVTDDASRQRVTDMIAASRRVLVVLPKWYGQNERGRRWITDADYIPAEEIAPLLRAVGFGAEIELQRLPAPLAWERSDGGPLPKIREPQVVTGEIESIVASAEGGILVGTISTTDDADVYILTDPDVLSNHGLRDPANALFAVTLIDQLRDGGPVVLDETLHGYVRTPSLLRTMITFPLVLATIQVLLAAALAVWAAMVRFGPRRSAPPPFAPGKDFLVRNTAALLAFGGHHAHALRRYLALAIAEVRHLLHAPAMAPSGVTPWLERVRLRRGGTIPLPELELAVAKATTPEQMLESADKIFRWRREMTDGTHRRS